MVEHFLCYKNLSITFETTNISCEIALDFPFFVQLK